MDDNTKKNSWDDLLQDLGAKPDDSAFERQQAPDQEIPPTVEWEEAEKLAEETKEAPGDWNSLAETLGLEVEDSPAPAEEPAAAKAKPPVAPVAKEPAPKPKKVVEAAEPFGGFAAPEESSESSFADEGEDDVEDEVEEVASQEFDSQDEFDSLEMDDELPPLPNQVDQALSETAWDDDSEKEGDEAAADDESAEGISGEAARSAFDALFSDGASGWGSAFLQKPKKDDSMRASKSDGAEETSDGEVVAKRSESSDAKLDATPDPTTDAKTDSESEGEEGERPKRKRSRRRRRGGRGRKSAAQAREGETAEGETSDEQSTESRDQLSEDQLSDEVSTEEEGEKKARRPRRRRSGQRTRPVEANGESESESDFDEDALGGEEGTDPDSPRGAGRGRQLHRNLPTWSEAIGMIVDANLEQRAKSPSKPQSSRGGRGGRGGRGRRRKSPESK